jgi:hypothetical protein
MSGGSVEFSGNINSNVSISNDIDIRFGTGDFTIEWFQYQTLLGNNTTLYPRIFSIGTYLDGGVKQGVSIEGTNFYYWENNSAIFRSLGLSTTFINVWNHFAITRSGTNLRIYRNGVKQGVTLTSTYNYSDTTNVLRIANESNLKSNAYYQGLITNFHWLKGTAKYTTDISFEVPTSPISPQSGTKILLRAMDSGNLLTNSSTESSLIANGSNVSWNVSSPFPANVPCLHPSCRLSVLSYSETGIPIQEWKPVCDLREGMIIETIYGPSRITHMYTSIAKHPWNRPFCIPKDCFKESYPGEDIIVSPLHTFLWNHKMFNATTYIDSKLDDYQKIYRLPPGEYTYYSVEVENRSLMKANGLWVNSCIRPPKEDEDY